MVVLVLLLEIQVVMVEIGDLREKVLLQVMQEEHLNLQMVVLLVQQFVDLIIIFVELLMVILLREVQIHLVEQHNHHMVKHLL